MLFSVPDSSAKEALHHRQGQRQVKDAFRRNGFSAYDKQPAPYTAHGLPTDMYGGEPNVIEGKMWWDASPYGLSGIVPFKKIPAKVNLNVVLTEQEEMTNGLKRFNIRELYGKSIGNLMKNGGAARVDRFRIAYTIMHPKGIKSGSDEMERLPRMLLIHGVPMNRRAKYKTMRWLARGMICVCVDMLKMGESDMPLDYGTVDDRKANEKSKGNMTEPMNYKKFQRGSIWNNDLSYMHQLMMKTMPAALSIRPHMKFILQADDWGTGIAMSYASHETYTKDLRMLFLLNSIMLDGYFVIEIGAIGKFAELYHRNPAGFSALAPILPQTIVGIEKYMIVYRERMNRYTETDYLFPYQDVKYPGRSEFASTAASMHHNEWGLLALAERSSRLAPRQLQPFHATENTDGLHTLNMKAPVHIIWGEKDQMMPPSQLDRAMYLWPNASHVAATAVGDSDHFVEIDQPEKVAMIMIRAINGTLGLGTTRTFLGIPGDGVTYKGDEPKVAIALNKIYRGRKN